MPSIADEVRAATARGELHPLVASNRASPRGLCVAIAGRPDDGGIAFCTLDFGHDGDHYNDAGARTLAELGALLDELERLEP